MNHKFKRLWSAAAAVAVAAVAAPLLSTSSAFALGTLQGTASIKNTGGAATLNSGNSDTTYTLRLPAGASCPGDSPNDGWRWQTYMVPSTVNPNSLTFGSNGPVVQGSNFMQPLFDTIGSPVVNQQTPAASPAPGPGPIVNIPDMNYAVFGPGVVPPGLYNIGIACTLGGASATQESSFWNTQVTITTNAATGGTSQISWQAGTIPNAPVLNTAVGGNTTCVASFTPAALVPGNQADTNYTVTAVGPTTVTASGAGSPITVTGLTNNSAYSVTVKTNNPVGSSAASNAISCTPNNNNAPVQNLSAVGGPSQVALSWNAPASGPAPTNYTVTYTGGPAGTPASPFTVAAGANPRTATVTGLVPGTAYTFTVTPVQATGTPTGANVVGTPVSNTIIIQDITVVRPTGALVLTQLCGKNGSIPADPTVTAGFPSGTPAVPASAGTGSVPTNDPTHVLADYPYPTDAAGVPNPTYPTNCGINLGNALFIKTGLGAGQFFAASGYINQVSVADTRDNDPGWNVGGQMSVFTNSANSAKTFSGNQLGWKPQVTSTTPNFTDGDGNSYTQAVNAGGAINPNTTSAAGGLAGAPRTIGVTPTPACSVGTFPAGTCTGGLGIATLDARLRLLIPVTAIAGTYTGTLTFSVI